MSVPPLPAQSTRYPRRDGNLVVPWIDGLPFYRRLLEVLRAARTRVWTAVSFVQPSFAFPDGGTLWEELEACVRRGVDVRGLFWRNPEFMKTLHVFSGEPADRAFLQEQGVSWAIRWDASPSAAHCHHQKTWVVDDDAFVGGMVLSEATLDAPGHSRRPNCKHDAFLEIAGPAAVDVMENFVQRWNEASFGSAAPWPDAATAGDLRVPPAPAPRGSTPVQITRTVAPGLYPSCTGGETDVWRQYQDAFAAAQRTIYLENQHPGEERLLELLDAALARGVRVVYVVPGEPMHAIREAKRTRHPRYVKTFERLVALGRHPAFTLAALATCRGDGRDVEIYTHAKLCLVDGEWGTCGSANLVDLSMLPDHTELNAAFWDGDLASRLLRQLVAEHTHLQVDGDDVEQLRAFAERARENAERRARGETQLGHCYALDPQRYAS